MKKKYEEKPMKLISTATGTVPVPVKNYFLKNFRLHHCKILSYRKLANIRKSMQIRKPFVQKKILLCFLPNFFSKMTSPQPVKCSILNFLYYLTQPTVQCTLYSTVAACRAVLQFVTICVYCAGVP